jgi:hypothetical protein
MISKTILLNKYFFIFLLILNINSKNHSKDLSIGQEIIEEIHSTEQKQCNQDLIASYIEEIKISETTTPVSPNEVMIAECPNIKMSCCSTFEIDYLLNEFDAKVQKIQKIKTLFENTVKYMNNINVNSFSKFLFHVMDKFEDKCGIKHIDLQLSRNHLVMGSKQIFEKFDQVFQKRIELKSSQICEFCDYKLHKSLLEGSQKTILEEEICSKFLKDDGTDYIDFMNMLWELALIREGLNCVYNHMNDPEYQLEQKLIKKMHIDVEQKVSIIDKPILPKHSRYSQLSNDEKTMLLADGSRSIIQFYAKQVVNNFEKMNLFDRTTLPNLEEQTEINGLIKHCTVLPTLKGMTECESLCKGYFKLDNLEDQIAPFLHEVIFSVNQYFYSTEDTKDKDSPKWREEISKDLQDEEYIQQVTFPHYLEVRKTQEVDYEEVDLSKLDLEIVFKGDSIPDILYHTSPYLDYVMKYEYNSSWTLSILVLSLLTLLTK